MKITRLLILSPRSRLASEPATHVRHAQAHFSAEGALSGLSEAAVELAMHRYIDKSGPRHALFYAAYLRVVDLANRKGWPVDRGQELLRRLTAAALYEAVDPPICGTCKGTGQRHQKICPTCDGSGRKAIPDATLAELTAIPPTTYRRAWAPRYLAIRDEMDEFVGQLEQQARFRVLQW